MAIQKILVPYNFSKYDQKALDFVIRTFVHVEDADVTLFSAYTPVPVIQARESPVMKRLSSSLVHLSQMKKEQETFLKEAAQKLVEAGFSEQRVHTAFNPRKKDIAVEIIALARKENFTTVVLNYKPDKITHFFTGSVFNKVVNELKDVVVCVVT